MDDDILFKILKSECQRGRPSPDIPPMHVNALFGPGNRGFFVLQSKRHAEIKNAPTIEAVIHGLLQSVPLSKIGTAFVHYPPSMEERLHLVNALRQAGFKNIQGISPLSLTLSCALIYVEEGRHLPLNGIALVVTGLEDNLQLDDCKVHAIEKCQDGWKVIVDNLTVPEALQKYPNVKDVVLCDKKFLKDRKAGVLETFRGRNKQWSFMKYPDIEQVYVQQYGEDVAEATPPGIFKMLMQLQPIILGSKIVLPYCDVVLSVVFGTENVTIPLAGQIAPFTVAKEIDIGSSTIVKVRGTLPNDKAGPALLKTFTFGKSMPRKVLVTVEVDKTLLPEVKLTTIGANQGEDDVKVTVKTPKAQPPKALSTPNLSIEFGGKVEVMDFTDQVLPFGQQKEFDVGDAMEVVVFACSDDGEIESKSHIKTLQFKKKAFRKVAVTVLVDETRIPEVTLRTVSTYKPGEPTPAVDVDPDSNALIKHISDQLSIFESTMPLDFQQLMLESLVTARQLLEEMSDDEPASPKLKFRKSKCQRKKEARRKAAKKHPVETVDVSEDDEVEDNGSTATLPKELPSPQTILTFTTDNRVQIQASKGYTGAKELLAYVCLQDGKKPMVGKDAFDALSTHPETVFYDVTRLLATDFDPKQPNPSWAFKATRNADGKIVVRGASGIATYPIVVFGLIVRSTLLYIQTHQKSEVAALGIRFPTGSTINDADLKDLSKYVGATLVLV